jgi:hypothetical protein
MPTNELSALIEQVEALMEILELDSDCQWVGGFREWLAEAKATHLAANHGQLVHLAAEAMRLFTGGMGGFNDYIPQRAGRVLPWADRVHELGNEVFSAALALRTMAVSQTPPEEL